MEKGIFAEVLCEARVRESSASGSSQQGPAFFSSFLKWSIFEARPGLHRFPILSEEALPSRESILDLSTWITTTTQKNPINNQNSLISSKTHLTPPRTNVARDFLRELRTTPPPRSYYLYAIIVIAIMTMHTMIHPRNSSHSPEKNECTCLSSSPASCSSCSIPGHSLILHKTITLSIFHLRLCAQRAERGVWRHTCASNSPLLQQSVGTFHTK